MGAFWALLHDYRVMRNDRGWFCFPEIFIHEPITKNLILLARYCITCFLPITVALLCRAKIPPSHQVSSLLLGRKYTGEEAFAAGIVHKTSSNADLLSTALTLAQETTSHGKEPYDRTMLAELKRELYYDVYEANNDVVLSCKL